MSSTSSAMRFATMRLGAFNEAFAAVYVGASSIGADDLVVLSRPFLWWDDVRITFEDLIAAHFPPRRRSGKAPCTT